MNKFLKHGLLAVGLLAVGLLIFFGLLKSKETPAVSEVERLVPFVRVIEVYPESRSIILESQGTVTPRTESVLSAQVGGRVVKLSPSLTPGGFFESGEPLLYIDPTDYELAIVEAKARVKDAEFQLALEQSEAELALKEWQDLNPGVEPVGLTLREPQLARAKAAVEAALASLNRAELNLARTIVRAPYRGRVQSESVDLGQVVAPNQPLGMVYGTDAAQVRLPLSASDFEFLNLALDFDAARSRSLGPVVRLKADFAGQQVEWEGRIIRTEGQIDPQSRMVHLVAEVKNPYSFKDKPPLTVGMFVEAFIQGKEYSEIAAIPRSALRDDGRVLLADNDNRLRFQDVSALYLGEDEVLIDEGLQHGDRVVMSPLAVVTEGMEVRISDSDTE